VARALLVATLAAFLAAKLYAIGHTVGDANIYLYLADRMADGLVPYRDFFHAHPPLHLLPGALLFRLGGGYTPWFAAAVPVAASFVTGVALHRAARTIGRAAPHANDDRPRKWGRVSSADAMGLLACFIYLFSFDVLRVSSHYVGASLAAMWLAVGLAQLARGRDSQAGVALALGAGTLLSVAPAGLALAALLAVADPRRALRFCVAGGGAFVVVNALGLFFAGGPYIDQVYLFHLGKGAAPSATGEVFGSILYGDTWLVFGGLAGVACFFMREGASSENASDRKASTQSLFRARVLDDLPLLAPGVAALASLAFLASLPRVFTYYFLPLFVCLAPLAGYGLATASREARALVFDRRISAAPVVATVVIILVAGLYAQRGEVASPGGETAAPVWRGSGIAPLDGIVRPLFWRDPPQSDDASGGRRTPTQALTQTPTPALSFSRYLWHEAERFDGAEALAREVRARSQSDETLFGDSTSAPLIALLAERRLALDEPDTNVMRFADPRALAKLLGRLEADPPQLVLIRPERGIGAIPAFGEWLRARYHSIHLDIDSGPKPHYELYERANSD